MREVAGTGGSGFYSPETDGNDKGCVGGNSGSSFYSLGKNILRDPKNADREKNS